MNRMAMAEANYAASIRGDKTVTRRVIGARTLARYAALCPEHPDMEGFLYHWQEFALEDDGALSPKAVELKRALWKLPRHKVGEIVALTLPHWRCNAGTHMDGKPMPLHIFDMVTEVVRYPDGIKMHLPLYGPIVADGWKRMAARYMPLWACLHFAEILSVRAERLHEITEEDAIAEGWPERQDWRGGTLLHVDLRTTGYGNVIPSARAWFRELWDSIHGPGAWERMGDDMVFVYGYRMVETPDE